MGKTFKIDNSRLIKLLNKCLLCESSPHTEYKIYRSALINFSSFAFYTKVSYRKGCISVPVCLRHYFLMLLARGLMFISVAAMLAFGILVLSSLMDYIFFPDTSGISAKYAILFFISAAVFIISLKWQPIRLK
ncbi:MAG: hypothetical protein Q8M56_01265, partial [Desulfobacterales bacterium]|nr:hypothetical protein [Desulfobacterales bacterium]